MDAAEEWLLQNTFYCSRLRARITQEQCQINHKRANQDGQFWAEKMPGVSLKKCRGCPGVNGEAREEEMDIELNVDQRKCNMCGRTKELEAYFRPVKGQEDQIDPKRVKTCIRCERRYGFCPQEYMDDDIDKPIGGPPTTEGATEGATSSQGSDDFEPLMSADEWEEMASKCEDEEIESTDVGDPQPPANDPLAGAIHLKSLQQYSKKGPVKARLSRDGRDLYISGQACHKFEIHSFSYCDFYLAPDQQTTFLHLHDNPTTNSRKVAVENRTTMSAGRVCCKMFAETLGWQPQHEWRIEGTSRPDVIKLVRTEQ